MFKHQFIANSAKIIKKKHFMLETSNFLAIQLLGAIFGCKHKTHSGMADQPILESTISCKRVPRSRFAIFFVLIVKKVSSSSVFIRLYNSVGQVAPNLFLAKSPLNYVSAKHTSNKNGLDRQRNSICIL